MKRTLIDRSIGISFSVSGLVAAAFAVSAVSGMACAASEVPSKDHDAACDASTDAGSDTGTDAGGTPVTVRVDLLDDTFAHPTEAETQHGALDTLQIGGDGSGGVGRTSYLKFDLSAIHGPITSARVYVYAVNAGGGGDIHRVASNNWQEETLTWNNRAEYDSAELDSLGTVEIDNWYSWDVSRELTGGAPRSFAVTSTIGNGAGYASKENTSTDHRPYLEVTYISSAGDAGIETDGGTPSTPFYLHDDLDGTTVGQQENENGQWGVFVSNQWWQSLSGRIYYEADHPIHCGSFKVRMAFTAFFKGAEKLHPVGAYSNSIFNGGDLGSDHAAFWRVGRGGWDPIEHPDWGYRPFKVIAKLINDHPDYRPSGGDDLVNSNELPHWHIYEIKWGNGKLSFWFDNSLLVEWPTVDVNNCDGTCPDPDRLYMKYFVIGAAHDYTPDLSGIEEPMLFDWVTIEECE